MALAAMNVTNAKSWVDAAKYVAASFAITIALAFLIVYLFWDKLQAAQVSESSTKNPSVQVEPATQPGAARSERGRQNSAPSPSGAQIGAYDALKDQLTPAERAEIERQIAVP